MGVLGWSPDVFWSATPHDLHAALDGWMEAHGLSDGNELTAEDVNRLRAKLDEALRGNDG